MYEESRVSFYGRCSFLLNSEKSSKSETSFLPSPHNLKLPIGGFPLIPALMEPG